MRCPCALWKWKVRLWWWFLWWGVPRGLLSDWRWVNSAFLRDIRRIGGYWSRDWTENSVYVHGVLFFEYRLHKLLVYTWRHSGRVGGQEQKHFSPLVTKLHFHVNSWRKNYIVFTPSVAALSRGCKPRIKRRFEIIELSELKALVQNKIKTKKKEK